MFKKPLSALKTSAPLRSSDRRKLRQKVVDAFSLSQEDGDALVPEGIMSLKFNTHLSEPGVAYLSPDGDPLWFTVSKSSEELIPTVYTLWKRDDLLPIISTPAAVIPVLVGGADLMIPGGLNYLPKEVIHHTPSIPENRLVSVLQYNHSDGNPTVSPPLAVGRMALPSDQLNEGGKAKGKAVHVMHTWKDHLWEMGSKADVPDVKPLKQDVEGKAAEKPTANTDDIKADEPENVALPTQELSKIMLEEPHSSSASPTYTPEEITNLLNLSLIQAIASSLASLPASNFPVPSTSFYTNYILPHRPAFPASILSPSGPFGSSEITIKTSSHKSLTTFLKAAEKASLLTLKSPPKHAQADLLVTSVNANHPSVASHKNYVTVKEIEANAAKKAQQAEKRREAEGSPRLVEVLEFWKPHQASLELFEGMGGDTANLYSISEVKALLNSYINSKSLVNPHIQAYINLDELLVSCLSSKSKAKRETEPEPSSLEFMKREELTKRILEKMQSWYSIKAPGHEPVQRKGSLKPIQVTMKIRQGRKACTLITGFEPFLIIDADDMAEELRKACAGSTSVSPIPGKGPNAGAEVFVQGKQSKAVLDYLVSRGVPKKWIEVSDMTGKK